MLRHMIKMNLTMRESYISPEAVLLDCDYVQALCTSTGLDGRPSYRPFRRRRYR